MSHLTRARDPRAGPGAVDSRRSPSTGAGRGQATVELALVVPLLILLVLALVQVGLLVRDRIVVTHAAREGARAAAVGASDREVELAATASGSIDPRRVQVSVVRRDGRVTVRVAYTAPTDVPLVGRLLDDIVLVGSATMRIEV